MSNIPLERYAATIAAEMHQPVNLEVTTGLLRLCDMLGQLCEFPGGCVAWLRCSRESLPLVEARDWHAVCQLSVRELTEGPVLYVAECLALQRGEIITQLKRLSRLAGVELWAGHRDEGTRWAVRRVRRACVEQPRRVSRNEVSAPT